jgi:taurine dioxygenase
LFDDGYVDRLMSTISVQPLTPAAGAEITGVDLSRSLDDASRGAIHQALMDHVVVFFRDQEMTPQQHIVFARQFGEVSVTPFQASDAPHPEVLVLDQVNPKGEGADRCHCDNSFMP